MNTPTGIPWVDGLVRHVDYVLNHRDQVAVGDVKTDGLNCTVEGWFVVDKHHYKYTLVGPFTEKIDAGEAR